MSRRARIQGAATALCLLCALLAGGTCAIAALAQTQGQATAPALARARGSVKRGHATKRSGCARHKRRHVKRCHRRHAPSKPAKPVAPAPLAPAALLSVSAVVAPPAPLPSPVASSPAPATTPSEAPPSEAPSEVEPPSIPHVQVSAVEYSFSLSRTSVPSGEVVLEFVNDGQDAHNLHLENGAGPLSESIPSTPSKGVDDLHLQMQPGSYTLFCSLPTHEARGMKATLTVE